MSKINKLYVLIIVSVMFLWALCYPLIVIGLDYAPHLSFAALRASIAGLILLFIALLLGKKQPKGIVVWLQLILIGVGATALGFYGMFHASEFVKPGLATVITNTQPMLTAVLAALLLKEKLSLNGKLGILLGFVGVIFIAWSALLNDSSNSYGLKGLFYLSISVLGISISNIVIKKIIGKVDALVAMGWQLFFGSIVLWGVSLNTENFSEITWNLPFISSLLGLALLGTALVYWLWFKILEKVELNYANSFAFLVPVFGLIMGMLFYQERLTIQIGIGILVIFAGIFIINKNQKNQKIKQTKLINPCLK